MRRRTRPSPVHDTAAVKALIAAVHYELVPMKSIDQAIADLPPAARVSITCSPVHGLEPTRTHTEQLLAAGHHPVPHLAARMVTSEQEATDLARWVRSLELEEVFVIAGDATEPHGPYEGAVPFLRDFLAADPGVAAVGIAGYPEGHPAIGPAAVTEHLVAKAALIRDAGLDGWISTQMCFDERAITTWIHQIRACGVDFPIRLGIPGAVETSRLLKLGARLGIGASLRYLRKNRAAVTKLAGPGRYDPTGIVTAVCAAGGDDLGIEALHCFTFNAVDTTRKWVEADR